MGHRCCSMPPLSPSFKAAPLRARATTRASPSPVSRWHRSMSLIVPTRIRPVARRTRITWPPRSILRLNRYIPVISASKHLRSQLGGTSAAPNIRSNLFTLPLMRFSEVQTNLSSSSVHMPYIARFNDATNPAFGTGGTVNGIPQFNANSGVGANQLMSRNDFSALVLQYRMRGATNYQLLDSGVVGYTTAQMETDAASGVVAAAGADLFQRSDPPAGHVEHQHHLGWDDQDV